MPDFATLLSEHIHNKNIKTYALAQYCNLDRSNMYKIIKGQRKPSSLEMVEKMCKFMHLSPSEQADMEESYHIALIGRENYYRRKAVQQFFEKFRIPTLQLPATSPSNASDYADNATLLHSHLEINRSLLYIIASELKKSGGKISLLIQPDYTFLMNILTAGDYASSSVDIDHIICLNNNQNVSFARQNYNLNCLRNILPLYSNHYQYNCYYYYDDIDAVTSAFALFPYAVITTEYACLISSDMQSGFITKDPESLKLFSYLFSQYLAQTTPLLRPVTDLGGQIQYVENTMQNITEGYFFQMLPCLTRFLTRDMLETYIVKDLPHRSELLDRLQNYLHELQSIPASADLTFICSIEGIRKFLNTGRVGEYPAYAYTPLNLSDRLFLIRQLANSMLNEHNRLLKRAIGMIDHEFYLFAGRQYGYFMFQTSNTDRMIYLNIEEPGLLFTFFDFCDTLDDEIFFTSEEAYRKIHDLIQEYSNKKSPDRRRCFFCISLSGNFLSFLQRQIPSNIPINSGISFFTVSYTIVRSTFPYSCTIRFRNPLIALHGMDGYVF